MASISLPRNSSHPIWYLNTINHDLYSAYSFSKSEFLLQLFFIVHLLQFLQNQVFRGSGKVVISRRESVIAEVEI